jgi:multidrug efflux pump subunit AcrB
MPLIGGEMFPETDNGYIQLRFKTPVGSSLEYTDSKVTRSKRRSRISRKSTSSRHRRHLRRAQRAQVNLKLTDHKKTHRRSQKELEKVIRARLQSIAGITLSVGWKPIFIAILGQDEAKLDYVARKLMDKMRTIKGVADIEYSQEGANPATIVKINNELASDLGLSVQQIGAALRPFRRRRPDQPLAGAGRPELRRQRAAAEVGPPESGRPGRPVGRVEQARMRPATR